MCDLFATFCLAPKHVLQNCVKQRVKERVQQTLRVVLLVSHKALIFVRRFPILQRNAKCLPLSF